MKRQEINNSILNMYNDSTYQGLKAYYDKTTIFNILGIERSENRHSAFLCWLLNANACHGLGDEPMKKLLRLYATKILSDDSFRNMLMTGNYELELTDILTEKTTAQDENTRSPKTSKKDRMDVWSTITLKDFYTKDKDLLVVNGKKIMCVKWWKKTDGSFQNLLKHVEQKYPYIQIEEY